MDHSYLLKEAVKRRISNLTELEKEAFWSGVGKLLSSSGKGLTSKVLNAVKKPFGGPDVTGSIANKMQTGARIGRRNTARTATDASRTRGIQSRMRGNNGGVKDLRQRYQEAAPNYRAILREQYRTALSKNPGGYARQANPKAIHRPGAGIAPPSTPPPPAVSRRQVFKYRPPPQGGAGVTANVMPRPVNPAAAAANPAAATMRGRLGGAYNSMKYYSGQARNYAQANPMKTSIVGYTGAGMGMNHLTSNSAANNAQASLMGFNPTLN